MSSGHGGARPGAGRKPSAFRFASEIQAAERRLADRLPKIIDNLFAVADGGIEEVEEEWIPARLVTKRDGELGEVPMYPEMEPDALVCVKRKVKYTVADAKTNMYLLDRILGKITQRVEIEESSDDAPKATIADLLARSA